MTKEQEETIEIIEKMVKSYIVADECGLSNNDFKHEIKAMQTVLNMLKEKDKEIEKLKADNKKAWKLNANMTQRHLSDIFKIKKKDKQIDLMADNLVGMIFSDKENIEIIFDNKEEIKQYFERKSEE